MAEFPTYEQMAKEVAEIALDEFLYDGKSIREWMKIIIEQEPCEDAISRADLIKSKFIIPENEYEKTWNDVLNSLYENAPSVQPKPKTGHWIEDDMTYCGVELVNYKCDKCGEMGGAWRKGLKPDKLPKYCMNCGAKMLPTDS
jgi:hypothetical protein